MFKRYVRTPEVGEPPVGGFFIIIIINGNMGHFHSESGKIKGGVGYERCI